MDHKKTHKIFCYYTKKIKKKTNEDLENWMSNLPGPATKNSIIYLAIPGSHNSMTYDINSHSKIAPDADETVRAVYKICPVIIRRWAKTQDMNPTMQLKLGIRYFDLRICIKNKTEFYYAHGCYACECLKSLIEINKFLNKYTKEFVILDFQHFYDLTHHDHEIFQNCIKNIFGNKIYGRNDGSLIDCSLENAWKNKKQVLIIYRRSPVVPDIFWTSDYWPIPWANTDNIKILKNFLDINLEKRTPDIGYTSQCIITPSPKYILPRFVCTLKFCVKRVNKQMNKWVKNQRAGIFQEGDKPNSNVFLADFVGLNDGEFCKNVIALNSLI